MQDFGREFLIIYTILFVETQLSSRNLVLQILWIC